ncbi:MULTISPECIES: hypothetical protein [Pantoea]|uniref:hypothetical protein n=1 Tax=Pantoea TaxID=53335 RepID=UPI000490AB1E|nr:hypothetical protein [Pantoea ananatis]MCW1775042.1 hypothetical protein [Pantoea ananatis]MDS7719396.1 hypothetical protein [Pantoea ananatis]UYK91739.1 hypothetical protein NG826_14455 [Pantoea ananatis]UYL03284.1 hypothetical protein NG830_08165 [Pantoea ananatis]
MMSTLLILSQKKTRTREVRASFLFFLDASARPFTDRNGNGGGNNCGVQAVITHSDLFFCLSLIVHLRQEVKQSAH